ncbi:MAG: TRAP transporter small permease subunit [Synergistota bacterium]|nr:TRAP transporter small permease subunit [Synergistota bacterium]
MDKITRFCLFYATILKKIVSGLVPVLILTVTYQIVARHISYIPRFLWTEEICRFTLNWLVMLGSALAVRNSDHFDIDILSNLTPRGREIQFWVVNSLIILSALLFTVFGWGFAVSGLRRRSLAAGLSMVWVYSSFMVFGVSSLLFQLEKVVRHFNKSETLSH